MLFKIQFLQDIVVSLKEVFKNFIYSLLALSLGLNLLLVYYLIFFQRTTLSILFEKNNLFYAWAAIVLTILTVVFFGISATFLIYRWQRETIKDSLGGKDLAGCFAGALSMGCSVCGGLLLPALGVVGGLSVFPFQGLELKAAALFLFGFSVFESSRAIVGRPLPEREKMIGFEEGNLVLNLNRRSLLGTLYFIFPILLLIALILLPLLPVRFNFGLAQKQKGSTVSSPAVVSESGRAIFEEINPPAGYETKTRYGDIGPRLIEIGAIDLKKFKEIYDQSGQPLGEEELKILTQGSDEKIRITPQNAHFLLNFFWAFGLANKNPILEQGPMVSGGDLGNFASTGGWTLGSKKATEVYSKSEIVRLNPEQQKILEDFAFNSYRPCCSNSTGFPDCNHGMAALGLGELMASQGASLNEIFEAFKYFNSFWFPQHYFDVAKYFQAKEGKKWSEVDSAVVAGKDYSTPQGGQRVKGWLKDNNLLEQPPAGGGGCGV